MSKLQFGDDKHGAYLRSLFDPRRMEAVRQFTEELNKAWRERTPEQIAQEEHKRAMRSLKLYANDYEMEADQQGISMPHYVRENR